MKYLQPYLAKAPFGLEEILAEELRELGAKNITLGKRAVFFDGDKKLLYKANLHLRTALRILIPIDRFQIKNEHQLYKSIQRINWSKYLDKRDTLAIDSTVHSSYFNHSQYVSLKTKDAIVDQFRKHYNIRPSVDLDRPTLRIHIHIRESDCTVLLDSSGSSLHKRGYRIATNRAPISEVLAAGMIMLSGWHGERPFFDLMCGSATIPCEAALIAQNIAPGTYRDWFGFYSWKDFDKTLWEKVRAEAREQEKESDCPITAADISNQTMELARGNLVQPAFGAIRAFRKDFFQYMPKHEEGLLMLNPPYGERFFQQDITEFYKAIGDRFKQHYAGYTAWVISSNKDAIKHVGLRPSKKITLFNGSLECKFHRFDMYSGTKKHKKMETSE